MRQAHARTGITAADFSRIRNADLDRFTVDRLMSIINRLGSRIEVAIKVTRAAVTLPVEIYSETRVREFDEAEAELEKVLRSVQGHKL